MRLKPLVLSLLLLGSVGVVTAPAAQAAYPGRNGLIALVRANEIYTVSPTGTGLKKITTVGKNYRPKWSPDGRRIAYIHEASAASKDIWFMNADGSGKVQVTHVGAVTGASWSPAGDKIVFGAPKACNPPGGFVCSLLETIKTTAPFGSPTILQGRYASPTAPLQDISGVLYPPAWDPNGSEIVFGSTSFPDSPDRYILTLNLANQDVEEIANIGGACCGEGTLANPQFSPSGDRVLVTWTPSGKPSRTLAIQSPAVGTLLHDLDAAFSPDGTKIVVMNLVAGKPFIFIQSPVTGTARTSLVAGYQPDWQPV